MPEFSQGLVICAQLGMSEGGTRSLGSCPAGGRLAGSCLEGSRPAGSRLRVAVPQVVVPQNEKPLGRAAYSFLVPEERFELSRGLPNGF